MEEKVLKAKKRDQYGKGASSKLRRDGFTPVVLYGKHYESTGLCVNTLELNRFLAKNTVGARLEVEIDGTKEMAIVKEIQRDPVKRIVIHVDFQHLHAGEKVKVALPIRFINQESVRKDLVIQKIMDSIEIESLPKNLVDAIEIDLDGLGLGDTITVAEIDSEKYPGIEFLANPDDAVVSIVEPSKYEEVAPAAAEGEEGEEGAEAAEGEEAGEAAEGEEEEK